MLVYMVYDKQSGNIVNIHRAIDMAGHSCICTQEQVLSTLPPHIKPETVGIISTDLEQIPSGREVIFNVDVTTGTLIKTPVNKESS